MSWLQWKAHVVVTLPILFPCAYVCGVHRMRALFSSRYSLNVVANKLRSVCVFAFTANSSFWFYYDVTHIRWLTDCKSHHIRKPVLAKLFERCIPHQQPIHVQAVKRPLNKLNSISGFILFVCAVGSVLVCRSFAPIELLPMWVFAVSSFVRLISYDINWCCAIAGKCLPNERAALVVWSFNGKTSLFLIRIKHPTLFSLPSHTAQFILRQTSAQHTILMNRPRRHYLVKLCNHFENTLEWIVRALDRHVQRAFFCRHFYSRAFSLARGFSKAF